MSGATVTDFLAYWNNEGEGYARRGDYDWMASQVTPGLVLEIGCGVGFGTQALVKRGCAVLAIDSLNESLETTRQRLGCESSAVRFLAADVCALEAGVRTEIEEFSPQTVVCWLMGAPAETTGATQTDAGQAVAAYREKVHRAVAELAASLPSVKVLHFVDRTAIPWQAKDIGRDTLVRYHTGKTLLNLPFTTDRQLAMYRKLEDKVINLSDVRRSHPSLKSVVPTLASLVAERKN